MFLLCALKYSIEIDFQWTPFSFADRQNSKRDRNAKANFYVTSGNISNTKIIKNIE